MNNGALNSMVYIVGIGRGTIYALVTSTSKTRLRVYKNAVIECSAVGRVRSIVPTLAAIR
jgi:uncharacterized protein YmfQ (DUF2313 family)